MDTQDYVNRRMVAGELFNRRENRGNGGEIAARLAGGLTVLRDTLYVRVHEDLRRRLGADSMLAPVSEEKTERIAKLEIEMYQIAVSAATAADRQYVRADGLWYSHWLARLRLGQVQADSRVMKRLAYYLAKTPDARRLAFTNVLASALPESRQAPLVLFRLLPPAVHIVTAQAFGDEAAADESRRCQAEELPAILDCHACDGRVLPNGEQCPECGNPLWKLDWLTAE